MASEEILTKTRSNLESELKETASRIKGLMQELESLKVKQEQIKGGIFTLDMVIFETSKQEQKEGESNGENTPQS